MDQVDFFIHGYVLLNNHPIQILITRTFLDFDTASGGFFLVPFCNDPNANIQGDIMLINNRAVMTRPNEGIMFPYVTI